MGVRRGKLAERPAGASRRPRVSGLEPRGSGQGELFEDPREKRARRAARAADAVRERLGDDSLTRARLLKKPRGSG